jgi:hypothetical protein
VAEFVEEVGTANVSRGVVYELRYDNTNPLGADPDAVSLQEALAKRPTVEVLGARVAGFGGNSATVEVIANKSGALLSLVPRTLQVPGNFLLSDVERAGLLPQRFVTMQLNGVRQLRVASTEERQAGKERTEQLEKGQLRPPAGDVVSRGVELLSAASTLGVVAVGFLVAREFLGD